MCQEESFDHKKGWSLSTEQTMERKEADVSNNLYELRCCMGSYEPNLSPRNRIPASKQKRYVGTLLNHIEPF